MRLRYPIETAVFAALLIIFNLPGLVSPSGAALFPSALYDGELWRWLTFPWAHISLYHLVLDGAAFLCLYDSLRAGLPVRLFHLASGILFSGLVPLLLDPRLETIGLRGLSGVTHGLAVVTAIEAVFAGPRTRRFLGLALLAGVFAKCAIEQSTGQVLLAEYHLGDVGLPVPACHLGGAIGGAFSSFVVSLHPRAAMLKRLAPVTATVLFALGCHSWREEVTLAGVPFEKARVERDEIIGVIKEDRFIAGRPCRRGWVHLYTNGIPSGFTASRAIDLPRFTIPPNTWVLQDRSGAVRICAFPQDTIIQGHLCRGGAGGPKGVQAAFYPSGALKQYFLRGDSVIQGVPCAAGLIGKSIELHDNGTLKSCTLSADFARDDLTFEKGTRIHFDEHGRPLGSRSH